MNAKRIGNAEGAQVAVTASSTSTLSKSPSGSNYVNVRKTPARDSVDLWLSGAWREDPGFHDGWSPVRPRRTNAAD
ncbi:MAG: hypothetical protein AAF447_13300 [Myxococcota bacterium]